MARWGLQVNRHGTSFIKINFNPRVCLAITFTAFCTGRTHVKQTLDGAKILNDSTEKQYDNFSPGIAKLRTFLWFDVKR
jgi:hypothetical protein